MLLKLSHINIAPALLIAIFMYFWAWAASAGNNNTNCCIFGVAEAFVYQHCSGFMYFWAWAASVGNNNTDCYTFGPFYNPVVPTLPFCEQLLSVQVRTSGHHSANAATGGAPLCQLFTTLVTLVTVSSQKKRKHNHSLYLTSLLEKYRHRPTHLHIETVILGC